MDEVTTTRQPFAKMLHGMDEAKENVIKDEKVVTGVNLKVEEIEVIPDVMNRGGYFETKDDWTDEITDSKNIIGKNQSANNDQCPDCGKTFPSKTHLNIHINAVHVIDIQNCSGCDKQFKNKSALKNHLKKLNCSGSKSGGKDFHCAKCELTFFTEIRLNRHIKIIIQSKNYSVINVETCSIRNESTGII